MSWMCVVEGEQVPKPRTRLEYDRIVKVLERLKEGQALEINCTLLKAHRSNVKKRIRRFIRDKGERGKFAVIQRSTDNQEYVYVIRLASEGKRNQ